MALTGVLTVRLLGRLEVCAGAVPVRIAGRHAQALIALLAMRPRPRLRDCLGADLWPESDGPSAPALRQALWLLRSGFAAAGLAPDRWLDADQDSLGIRADANLNIDIETFEHLAASGIDGDEERAVRMYRGDLLEGLGHECFAAERERLSDVYEDLLARLAEARLARGDIRGAGRAATELLGRDPLREEAHAVLISVYGRSGSGSQVVRQYRRLCGILRSELAVLPLPETDAAYRSALARATVRSADRVADIPYERTQFAPRLVTSA